MLAQTELKEGHVFFSLVCFVAKFVVEEPAEKLDVAFLAVYR